MIDTSSLRNAIAQLDEAMDYCRSDLAERDPKLARHLRAAAIQAFEFTYELAIKLLRRSLAETEANPADVRDATFNELIRLGYARGLLVSEIIVWKEFRRHRGSTSHAYDEAMAEEVFAGIPAFLTEAKTLLANLATREERNS